MNEEGLLHRIRSANQEQLAILLQGVEVWNQWRANHPHTQIQLSEIDLRPASIQGHAVFAGTGATLRGINLAGATLRDAHLERADLYGARLEGAYLGGAHLEGAVLQAANLSNAILSSAHLDEASLAFANLRGALLQGAKLKGASLHHADLREADLRGVHDAVYDESKVVFAISGLAAKDPWSILRRKYTGVMLLFHLVILLAFVLPYAGRAAFWRAVNHGQVLYSNVTAEVISELRRLNRERNLNSHQWRGL